MSEKIEIGSKWVTRPGAGPLSVVTVDEIGEGTTGPLIIHATGCCYLSEEDFLLQFEPYRVLETLTETQT